MSNLEQLLERLFSMRPLRHTTLSRMTRALEAHNNPHHVLEGKVVQVTGSNGKGSVTHKLSRALQAAGLKVGTFTSPHIFTFEERIRINSCMIPQVDLEKLLQHTFDTQQEAGVLDQLSFFDLSVLVSLQYFAAQKVPQADPADFNTNNAEIARVCLCTICDQSDWLRQPLQGLLSNNSVINPILESVPMCRFESWPREALVGLPTLAVPASALPSAVVFDVAHNPGALTGLFQRLASVFPRKSFRVVCQFSANKDLNTCAEIIANNATGVHLLDVVHDRLSQPDELLPFFTCYADRDVSAVPGILATLQAAFKAAAAQDEVIVVCGSFFIMRAVREALGVGDQPTA
eukprot:gene1768-455_t